MDPKKSLYRQRAHANPFKDTNVDVPRDPESVDWTQYFGMNRAPDFVDIGCGYGKFLMKVAERCPEHNVLGIELRSRVYEYVRATIEHVGCANAGVMKTNAMIFLPNVFRGGQLSRLFILFPDPHFKKRKQKARIVSPQMMEMYEYLLRSGGRLYISTDVKHLFDDMVEVISSSGMFRSLTEEEQEEDELFAMTSRDTDEALRAGVKTGAVFAKAFEVQK